MYREVYKRICCALPEHSLEPVEHICLQNACCSTPLICALCKLERHTVSDKTVSLHEFLAALAKNCLQAKSTVRKCAFLDSIMLRLNAKVKLLRQKVTDKLTVEAALNQFNQSTKRRLLEHCVSLEQLSFLPAQYSSALELRQQISSWIRTHGELCEVALAQMEEPTDDLTVLSKAISHLEAVEEELGRLEKMAVLNDEDILDLLDVKQTNPIKRLYFSQEMKSPSMTITNRTLIAVTTASTKRMALLQPSLEYRVKSRKWRMKIVKLASWIGVGVCSKQKLIKADYNFLYTQGGHGNYIISSNGYSWNGYQMEFNSKCESFSFTGGDIILLEYRPKEHTISYLKEGSNLTYMQHIDPTESPINAVVNLTSIGDSVELIE